MMRALILSSRCTAEQRLALMELRAFLEEYGDTCEMLDWLSFLSDTVSEINTHSRTLVRRHIQELLAGAFQSNSRKEEEPKEKGVRRLIEYIGGLLLLKGAKIRLWDYSNCRGNIQGLICPLFSFFWALLSTGYYFLIHPHILTALAWFSENLAFSFVIGFFFGACSFFFAFRSKRPLAEHLREAHEAMEKIMQKRKTDKIG